MTDREKLRKIANWFVMSTEGEDYHLEEAYAFLHKEGFTDADGFWIYPEESTKPDAWFVPQEKILEARKWLTEHSKHHRKRDRLLSVKRGDKQYVTLLTPEAEHFHGPQYQYIKKQFPGCYCTSGSRTEHTFRINPF